MGRVDESILKAFSRLTFSLSLDFSRVCKWYNIYMSCMSLFYLSRKVLIPNIMPMVVIPKIGHHSFSYEQTYKVFIRVHTFI